MRVIIMIKVENNTWSNVNPIKKTKNRFPGHARKSRFSFTFFHKMTIFSYNV